MKYKVIVGLFIVLLAAWFSAKWFSQSKHGMNREGSGIARLAGLSSATSGRVISCTRVNELLYLPIAYPERASGREYAVAIQDDSSRCILLVGEGTALVSVGAHVSYALSEIRPMDLISADLDRFGDCIVSVEFSRVESCN